MLRFLKILMLLRCGVSGKKYGVKSGIIYRWFFVWVMCFVFGVFLNLKVVLNLLGMSKCWMRWLSWVILV